MHLSPRLPLLTRNTGLVLEGATEVPAVPGANTQ